jgi:hypothetical protein
VSEYQQHDMKMASFKGSFFYMILYINEKKLE